ncbi:MAG: hypothetical protein LBJ18_04645 [Rickettsiales bacterium]|jgi:tetratricopeptide (TPR) repeat protein|nr:hypothetical protein [Rickettsiales bacterium]
MLPSKNIFAAISLTAVIVVCGGALWHFANTTALPTYNLPDTKYGAFLAAQHAVYINDFNAAADFSKQIPNADAVIGPVQNVRALSAFLSGNTLEFAKDFAQEKSVAARLIYDANLLDANDWAALYARHKNDDSAATAALRIWPAAAIGKTNEALKILDKLQTSESQKAFIRGQIYAESGKTADAAAQFAKVPTEFLNINDYLYLMSFYEKAGNSVAANALKSDFTTRPGGMFILALPETRGADFSGYKNALAFSLIQTVSHSPAMAYSDLALLLLRFAESAGGENDALNYYLGQYFWNNGGDYNKYFDKIDPKSPFYPFAVMKIAEKTGKIAELERIVRANPLFVPAINKLVAKNMQNGREKDAIRVLDRALRNENLGSYGRAFFLKTKAQAYFTAGDAAAAQKYLRESADILPKDASILGLQARIWAARGTDLDSAYEYAIALIKKYPAEIENWDTLAMVVQAKEGNSEALEILERVGRVAESCSVLFLHLGDIYAARGNSKLALDAYSRAIYLSDDGLVIKPELEKKIRKLK